MKKLLLVFAIIILFPAMVSAEWLAAGKSPDAITKVQIEKTVSGVTTVVSGVYIVRTDDVNIVNILDLTNLAPGNYRFRAQWATVSSLWSDWSDPFDATKPIKPGNVGVRP